MKKTDQELPDNQVATQRNDLIHGQQTLSLVQKRIFALTLKQIGRNDDDLKMYTIEIRDLVQAGTSANIFSKIETEADSLMKKILLKKEEIPGIKHPKTTRWGMVSKAIHHPGEGTLSIRLNPEIRDMLLELKEQGGFTPVPVAELMACRSTYGQRLYEMLYSWRKDGKWEVSVEKLRFSLGVEKKYPNFTDFRRYILEKAQKDLKKNTNMRFDWEEESRGKGKKITHITFTFELVADQMDLALDAPAAKKFDAYNLRDRLKKFARLDKKEIDKFMDWLSKKSKEEIHQFAKNLNTEFEIPIDSKTPVSNGKPIQDQKKYFKAHYKEWA